MRWNFLRAATVAVTFASLMAACDGGVSPNEVVLVGQFGAADEPAELLATHTGVELVMPCSYFSAERPAILEADGSFEVRGAWYLGAFYVGPPEQGTLSGRLARAAAADTVTFTFRSDDPGFADQKVFVLRRAEHYTGPDVACGL